MKLLIELDTEKPNTAAVTIVGASTAVISRDHALNWRNDGFWIANSSATVFDALRVFVERYSRHLKDSEIVSRAHANKNSG